LRLSCCPPVPLMYFFDSLNSSRARMTFSSDRALSSAMVSYETSLDCFLWVHIDKAASADLGLS